MIDLALSILTGLGCGLAYKFAVTLGNRRLYHLLIERCTAAVLLLCAALFLDGYEFSATVAAVALVAGGGLLLARWCLLRALDCGRAGPTFTVWNLAIAVPVLISILAWQETPSPRQLAGLIMVPVCVLLLNERKDRGGPDAVRTGPLTTMAWLLFALLCFAGEGVFATCFKVIEEWDLMAGRHTFLLLYNAYVTVFLLPPVLNTRDPPRKRELAVGAASALGFVFSGIFGLRAIHALEGIVYFPIMCASYLVLLQLASFLIWKERTTRAQTLGMILAVAAIVLIAAG